MDLASAKPIELAAGQQVRTDIRIVRRAGVRVRGRLAGLAAEAVPSGRMRYTRLMLAPRQEDPISANGPFALTLSDEFEFADVLPGSYTLLGLTIERPVEDYWGGSDKPYYGIAQPIEIKDQDIDGLSVPLEPLRDVPGVITFIRGCAPVPVRIVARGMNRLSVGLPEAVSGADGKFVLRGLSPGKLRLSFLGASVVPLSVWRRFWASR